jgi:hypothetical protein
MDRIEHLRKRAPQSDLPGYIRLSDEQGAVKIIEEKCGLNEEEKTQLIRTLHFILGFGFFCVVATSFRIALIHIPTLSSAVSDSFSR